MKNKLNLKNHLKNTETLLAILEIILFRKQIILCCWKIRYVSNRLAKLEESGEDTLATVEENKMMIDEIKKETQEDAANLSSIVIRRLRINLPKSN